MINYQEKDKNYRLLPVGRLRETHGSLKRSDLIIWSKYKKNLKISNTIRGSRLFVAYYIDNVRLIDNF